MAEDLFESALRERARQVARTAQQQPRSARRGSHIDVLVGTPLADAQRELIEATLDHFRGDKRAAAQALGISLKTLYNRLELYRSGRDDTAPAQHPGAS